MPTMHTIRSRHSVRQYENRPVEGETLRAIEEMVESAQKIQRTGYSANSEQPRGLQRIRLFRPDQGRKDADRLRRRRPYAGPLHRILGTASGS